MKKIITLLLTICLFISNGIGGIYAYETKSIIENSTLEISHTLGKTKYKIYHTNKVIGNIPKNTVFILDSKGKIVTDENTIKKLVTFHLVTSKNLREQVIKQRDAYKTQISVSKKLKNCVEFIKFQSSVIKASLTSGKSIVNDVKKYTKAEFDKKFDPRAKLVSFAVSELEKGVKEYDKFLNKKINTYEDAIQAASYLDKGISYSPANIIIDEWAKNIEKNLNTKNFLSIITGGISDKIGDSINKSINSTIKKYVESAKSSISKVFKLNIFKNADKVRNNIKKVNDIEKNLKELQDYINTEYKKIEPYNKYIENKNKIIKDKVVSSQLKSTDFNKCVKRNLQDCKKVNTYANLKIFSKFTVSNVNTNSKSLSGKGEKDATIKVYVGSKQIGKTVKVDSKGNYNVTIPKQKYKVKITIKMSKYGYREISKIVTVSK